MRSPWSLLFCSLNSPSPLSLSSLERCSSPLICGFNRSTSFLCWGPQTWMQHSRWGLTRAEQRGTIPSLDLLATPQLMQPMMQLAFWAASMNCWLMLSLSSTRTPKFFYTGLLSIGSSPSLYSCPGLLQSRCSTLHLDLLNLIRFTWAHFSSLSRSL